MTEYFILGFCGFGILFGIVGIFHDVVWPMIEEHNKKIVDAGR